MPSVKHPGVCDLPAATTSSDVCVTPAPSYPSAANGDGMMTQATPQRNLVMSPAMASTAAGAVVNNEQVEEDTEECSMPSSSSEDAAATEDNTEWEQEVFDP